MARVMPRLARESENPKLSEVFETHLEETHGQIERIDKIMESSELKLKRIKSSVMEGLIEGAKELINEIGKGPVRDAALIGVAQKIEHYEIACYGTLAALAKQMGLKEVAGLLAETLEEEKANDQKLTRLAEQGGQDEKAAESGK